MANPMALFRKHQKVLLAVFGVALMLVFTVGSIVNQYLYRANNAEQNQVVVETKTESLRESDVRNLQFARHNVLAFMRAVNQSAAEKGVTPRDHVGVPNTTDEASVVQTAILARQAEQAGIEITDEAILNFLIRYSQDKLTKGDFARILEYTSRGSMSQLQFFDAMRRELLAQRFIAMFRLGILPPTPELAWEYFQRLNRRVSLEAVPFEVSNYLARVEEPSETQVQAMYEEGKNRYPQPGTSENGFRQMRQVAVHYVKADLAKFLPAAKTQITDEQVKLYYETNREEFRALPASGTPATPASPASPDDSQIPLDLDLPLQDSPTTDPAEPATTAPDPGAGTGTGTTNDAEPPVENPATNAPASEPPAAAEEPNESEDISTKPTAAQESAVEEAADTIVTDPQPTDTAVESGTEAETQPADPLTELPAAATQQDPLGDLPEAAGNNVAAPAEFKPLEEVADEIRTRLATPIARQAMDQALSQVRGAMRSHYSTFLDWELSPERESTPQPPAPDLSELADKLGLTVGTIPLVTVYQLEQTDPATGEPLYEISRAFDMNLVPFRAHIFADDVRLYDVRSIRGPMLDTEYLFWKTAEVAERVPPLEDVRDQVVRAIKMRQARELAQKDAQQAADQLNQSHQRPRDAFANDPNRPVIDAQSVTWMTNSPYSGPVLTQIPGIEFPGDTFMRDVFALQPGTAGVAMDSPQDTAYVVAVTKVDSDDTQLRDQFLRSGVTPEITLVAMRDRERQLQNWYSGLEKELDIKWLRDPRAETRSGP